MVRKIERNKDAVKAIQEKSVKGEDIERMLICVDVLKGLISNFREYRSNFQLVSSSEGEN